MNPRAKNVEYSGDFKFIITFTNEEVKEFDLKPYLKYPIYAPLKIVKFCKTAKIKYGTLVWNEEIDIDPDRLFIESKLLEPLGRAYNSH